MATTASGIPVSAEDRSRIAALHQQIADLEGQIASIIGGYARIEAPRLAREANAESGDPDGFSIRVVGSPSGAASAADSIPWSCGIYKDPPGICLPCPETA